MALIYTDSKQAWTKASIFQQLQQLRQNALADFSGFSVAALLEIVLPSGDLAYVSGVNVEQAEHNRLSLHAEQLALLNALALLGKGFQVKQLWLMGALCGADQEAVFAHHFVSPCGHCRQIMLDFLSPSTAIIAVTLKGDFSEPQTLADLLPSPFGLSDLNLAAAAPSAPACIPSLAELLRSPMLSLSQFRALARDWRPGILNSQFATSPIRLCLLRAKGHAGYFMGCLAQDRAFLTTDAVFAATAAAITELGAKQFCCTELHLLGDSLEPSVLSGVELQQLLRFSTAETQVQLHTPIDSSPLYPVDALKLGFFEKLGHYSIPTSGS